MTILKHCIATSALSAIVLLALTSCSNISVKQPNMLSGSASSTIDPKLLLGKWNCHYQQNLPDGLSISAKSIDEFKADGTVSRSSLMTIQIMQHSVDYKLNSSRYWQLTQNVLREHDVKLSAFEVSDPEFENIFQLQKDLQHSADSQTQIVQLSANSLQLKSLDAGTQHMQNVQCIR